MLVNECHTAMFIKEMDISYLMTHTQQIKEENLMEFINFHHDSGVIVLDADDDNSICVITSFMSGEFWRFEKKEKQ